MKVLILAGGLGSRLREETTIKPKPMVEIGGRPILWHIMKSYSNQGYNDFVILLGYKGYLIKEYFINYFIHQSDLTVDLSTNKTTIHDNNSESWKVSLIDTGNDTMTGGRIKRALKYINNEPFLLTYGDGVSDVNIKELVDFHKKNNKFLTLTAVQPEGRFGALKIEDDLVSDFKEKPKGDDAWINGGFFVCQPQVLDYIENDASVFENEPMYDLASNNQIAAWKHHGFWQCMDTQRDKRMLEQLWQCNNAKWKTW